MFLDKLSARQGFTLVELLITLFVMSFCLLLAVRVPFDNIKDETTSRLFFTELDATIKYAQEISILQQVEVIIHFDAMNDRIVIYSNSSDLNQEVLLLPTNWQIMREAVINYNQNGSIRNFQRIVIKNTLNNAAVHLNFQLGSGRYILNYLP